MSREERTLKATVGHEYYHPDGTIYVPKEMALIAMREYARETNIEKDKEIAEFKKQAEGWKAAFEILEYLIKIKDEKSPKDFRVLTNKIVQEIKNNL